MNFTNINKEEIVASGWGLHLSKDGKLIAVSPSHEHLEKLQSPYVQVPPGEAKQCKKEFEASRGNWPTIDKWAECLQMWGETNRRRLDLIGSQPKKCWSCGEGDPWCYTCSRCFTCCRENGCEADH